VVKYDIIVSHLAPGDNPYGVWKKAGGVPGGSRVAFAGGDGSRASNTQLLCTIASLAHRKGVKIDGYFDGTGLWADNTGRYFVHALDLRPKEDQEEPK
jgi:hypothetical protein